MRRDELPNPTRFYRRHTVRDGQVGPPPGTTLAPDEIWGCDGPPIHPVIIVKRGVYNLATGQAGVQITMMLHQDAFWMPGRVIERKYRKGTRKGQVYTVESRLPKLSETIRYCTMIITQAQFDALPVCTWGIRGDRVVSIEQVEEALVSATV